MRVDDVATAYVRPWPLNASFSTGSQITIKSTSTLFQVRRCKCKPEPHARRLFSSTEALLVGYDG